MTSNLVLRGLAMMSCVIGLSQSTPVNLLISGCLSYTFLSRRSAAYSPTNVNATYDNGTLLVTWTPRIEDDVWPDHYYLTCYMSGFPSNNCFSAVPKQALTASKVIGIFAGSAKPVKGPFYMKIFEKLSFRLVSNDYQNAVDWAKDV